MSHAPAATQPHHEATDSPSCVGAASVSCGQGYGTQTQVHRTSCWFCSKQLKRTRTVPGYPAGPRGEAGCFGAGPAGRGSSPPPAPLLCRPEPNSCSAAVSNAGEKVPLATHTQRHPSPEGSGSSAERGPEPPPKPPPGSERLPTALRGSPRLRGKCHRSDRATTDAATRRELPSF